MSDMRAAMAEAIQRRADEDTTSLDEARRARSVRSPDMNNPMAPVYRRPPRGSKPEKWGRTPYYDPVGDQAAGFIKKEDDR